MCFHQKMLKEKLKSMGKPQAMRQYEVKYNHAIMDTNFAIFVLSITVFIGSDYSRK